MGFDWVQWFGYFASVVILISLTMTSIIKLRWINFIGCLLFALFAYLIDSIPTIFMNIGIACINLYFIAQIYRTKEEFKIIKAAAESEFYQHFIHVNHKDIEKQIALSEINNDDIYFYMRNNIIAGILVGRENLQGIFDIKLDYVIPQYRDFKLGTYYFQDHPEFFKEKGFTELKTSVYDETHRAYLEKVGFIAESENDPRTYIKYL